jgi:hypothetical protein
MEVGGDDILNKKLGMTSYSTVEAWNGVGGISPLGDLYGTEGTGISQSITADDRYFKIELHIASFPTTAIQDDLDLKLRVTDASGITTEETPSFTIPRTASSGADSYYRVTFWSTKELTPGMVYSVGAIAVIDSQPSAGYLGSIIGDSYLRGSLSNSRNDAAMRLEFGGTYLGESRNNLKIEQVSQAAATQSNTSTEQPSGVSIGNITGDGNIIIVGGGNSVNIGNNVNSGNTTYTTNNSYSIGTISLNITSLMFASGSGADPITGSLGADLIGAGKGADRLTGNAGADKFIFNTKDSFGKKGADTISDFKPDEGDMLVVNADALPGLSNPKLTTATSKSKLTASQKSGASLIYYQPLGQLFYDQNGSAKGYGSGGLFAILTGAPSLSAENLGILQ